ncbi:MAG TPA: Stk1 family PASTA domain-containing Ser/Thr kinase [Mycobacteriales bacterium]|jgi:serine/threonine-protein kinase|nr:Stk1 family PASTA domain-containing Ser/Thr kinase [Mycobacteriales bacterium]
MTDARLLGGRYQLGEVLGYGGMAEVHRGRDQRLGRDVAVKVLRADLARDPGFQMRFRREAQNAAALNHPAIVAVYDTGEEADGATPLPYIVMEYVGGRTLKEVLTEERRLMPERAMEITADICAALDFSHKNGIVHRDIKPGNVMLTPTGTVKVMDFGIARAVASGTSTMTQTSAVIGTAQYLSPEQARGESVDARSDVYSTGCLLYELLTGQPPFTGDSPVSVAYQHVREDPVPPGQVNPDVTPTIDAIVLKAMAKNPANRYQSAGDMRADLLRAVAGRPISATPVMSDAERTELIAAPTGGGNGSLLPADDRRSRRGLAWTGIVLAILGVFAAAALLTAYLLGDNTPQVDVPNVLHKQEQVARSQLEQAGFRVTSQTIAGPRDTQGQVTAQNPSGGTKADKGSTVSLTVNGGPDQVAVPNFVGMSKAAAEQTAQQKKLKLAEPVERDSAKAAGTVLSQDPPAGASVDENTTVRLTVSNGKLATVPNVVGKMRDPAVGMLFKAGFEPKVSFREDGSVPEGQVIEQNPRGNQRQPKGSTVTIVVATAPAASPTPSASASPSPSASASPLFP